MVTRPLAVRLKKQADRYERAIDVRARLSRRQARSMKQSAFDQLAHLLRGHDRVSLKAAFLAEGGPEDPAAIAAGALMAFVSPAADARERYTNLTVMRSSLAVLAQAAQPPAGAATPADADQAGAIPDAPAWSSRKDLFG